MYRVETYLNVVVLDRRDATVLTVSGELDMASSPALDDVLGRIDSSSRRRTILDLDGLEFMDVTGLRVLLRAHERVRKLGGHLILINVRNGVRRLLTLSGATDLLGAIE